MQAGAVASEAAAFYLEPQQTQPIPQKPQSDQVVDIRNDRRLAAAHTLRQQTAFLLQPPETGRIESEHHQTAFRHQHAGRLAQNGVRIGAGFQSMRQHHQIHAGFAKGQGVRFKHQGGSGIPVFCVRERNRRLGGGDPSVLNAAVVQKGQVLHANLQGVVAEAAIHGLVGARQFPVAQELSWRRGEPLLQIYNWP